MANCKYIIKSSSCVEYFCRAIRNVTYMLVMHKQLHAEENENRAISFYLLLKSYTHI